VPAGSDSPSASLTLLVSPAGQRPISYARAAAEYYLGSNEYHNRRTRPEPETPVTQDVVYVRQAGLDIETIEAEQEAKSRRTVIDDGDCTH